MYRAVKRVCAFADWGPRHGRPHIGANWGQLTPGKMDEKLDSENMQKQQFSMFMLYFQSNQGRQV